MADAFNLSVAWDNLFDAATISVAGVASTTPAIRLQHPDVAKKCRVVGTTAIITATWALDQTADTFGLFGIGDRAYGLTYANRFLATGTERLQLTSNGGATGDVYNGSATAGVVDPLYGYAINLLSSKTFRSATWTLVQVGADYVDVGRGFAGVRTQLEYNCALGPGRTVVDPSTSKQTDGMQTKFRVRPKHREQEMTLSWITEAQGWSVFEAMDHANGRTVDALWLFDPSSSNLGRDSIWGTTEPVPTVTPGGYDDAGGLLRSRSLKVIERG